jgi:hypothetical protein
MICRIAGWETQVSKNERTFPRDEVPLKSAGGCGEGSDNGSLHRSDHHRQKRGVLYEDLEVLSKCGQGIVKESSTCCSSQQRIDAGGVADAAHLTLVLALDVWGCPLLFNLNPAAHFVIDSPRYTIQTWERVTSPFSFSVLGN